MQSIENQSVFEVVDHSRAFSGRWLLRRLALWILFVALGVTGSCLLYRAAGVAEAEAPASQTARLAQP